jgi:SNF2 family DNA or RNA helicase
MANKLSQELATANSALPPPYQVLFHNDGRQVEPVPHLHVQRAASGPASVACLTMLYGEARINPLSPSAHYCITTGNQLHLYKRDKKAEAHSMKQLAQFGLRRAPYVPPNGEFEQPACVFGPADQSTPWFWLDFATESVPCLQESHFHIEIDADCCMDVVTTDDESIEASFTQNGAWWFSLDLGITINGQRTALLPILVSFLRLIHSPDDLDRLTAGKRCYVPLPDGRHVALPSERVKTILQTLIELFGPKPLDDKGQLRISFDLASALLKIKDFTRKRWFGEGQLKNLVEKLSNFEGIAEAPLPAGLHAELRPYQKQGYDWLHFLGAYNLGGVLADDMGLGKTVQALAYILALKKSKKTNPCLVIMPTSLISNWQTEAARFAPYLKIVTLHGKDRAILFDTIESADLVFSTYPLVIRDIEKLASYKWGLVILDEAQAIKNPTSKITQAVCMLDAKQRLCLTGTPLENHLGEIWSIFAFLMPGLLGDYNDFSRQYRTPIEKHGDAERQTLLSRRLRPFILRRLKTNVAKELPPKTEIIQRVTLGDDQRDLYETVRHVMNDKLRDEISNKGFARSQIAILDALLKLRQVCCDPRLVKIAVARKATTSAKLEALMEMLPTLIEDGRRILLFSQFTSMLDLIKPALDDARIPYVELRGTTKDRRTPISKFQKKEVPLFLISLKAGGTGLNLTAADTVIHFDPWWNPSVENQATDRAHRIGQDKPVFVYKLIANGTVEERILDLQAKKANLANAIFGDKPSVAPLTQDDMRWLLEGV